MLSWAVWFKFLFNKVVATTCLFTLTSINKQPGVSRFSMESLLSQSTEKLRRGTLLCFRKFRVSKNFMPKRGISRFSIKNMLSHSTEKLRRGTLLCFKFSGIEKFYGKEGGEGGSITIFCQNFLSHSAKKFRRGTLLCFRKFLVSKNFMEKRRGEEGGSIQIFRRIFFVSQCRKFRKGTL